MITRTYAGISGTMPMSWSQESKEIAEYAIATFGFIIPIRTPITWPDFAKLITQYSDNERSRVIANTICQ